MSSSKKASKGKGKGARNTTGQNQHPQEEQKAAQKEEPDLFNYGAWNSEETAGRAVPGFDHRGLDQLGPLYQATQYPSRTITEQGDFPCAANVFPTTGQPAFSAVSQFAGLQAGAAPADAVALNWHPIDSLYGSDGSPGMSTGSSASMFGFSSQQDNPNPHAAEYNASHTALQNPPHGGFEVYPWPGHGDGGVSVSTSNPGTLPSPSLQSFEMLAVTSERTFPTSDPALLYRQDEGWQREQHHQHRQQQQQQEPLAPQPPLSISLETASPRRKRAKKSDDQKTIPPLSPTTPLAPPPTGSGSNSTASGTGRNKLRTANHSSKGPQQQQRSDETPRERRTRNSHNMVEKHYRDRLNLQFEILMNTLPESMRSPGAAAVPGGGRESGGDGSGLGSGLGLGGPGVGATSGAGVGAGVVGSVSAPHHGAFDIGERRLSKAQVLDMSARYIRALERERDGLVVEREELRENCRRLKEKYEVEEEEEG